MPLSAVIGASLALSLLIASGALASTITVNSVADTIGDDGACTLREAIIAANTDTASGVSAGECAAGEVAPTVDTIAFAIPGAGVHTISPLSALPMITQPVTIDGYTQPGSSPNTNPTTMGLNAVITIELRGMVNDGLNIQADNCTVKGLVINSFPGNALDVFSNGNVITGNFIGTNTAGTAALPNGSQGQGGVILVSSASNNTVGGTTPAARNLISGNIGEGISVQSGTGNVAQGNLIGTDVTGSLPLGNTDRGVFVFPGSNALVGGTTVAARNVISGNNRGVDLFNGSNNAVQGNFIGTDVTGTVAIANTNTGVDVSGASNSVIGGLTATPGTPPGNLISGNDNWGVQIGSANANIVQGNIIGADIAGTQPLGNLAGGGIIISNSPDNAIGGTAAGAGNIIAFNGGGTPQCTADLAGIWVHHHPAINNAILGNPIFHNAGLGIDLEFDGDPNCVEPNDHCDSDTGPNDLQNYPLIAASFGGGNVMISGTLDSVASTMFRLEFFSNPACDSSGFGEGKHFLGSTVVTTGADCAVAFGPLSFPLPTGDSVVAATASRLDGGGNPVETSEFSACFAPPTTTTTTTTVTTTSVTTTTTTVTSSTIVTSTTVATTSTSQSTVTTSTVTTSSTHTTTTTQPATACEGVPAGPTFVSIDCRLVVLIADVQGASALGALQTKLLDQLQKAKMHKEQAEVLCRQASKRRTRNALRPAINKLSQFLATLGARKAKTIPSALKDSLRTSAAAIRSDMQVLQRALQCPQDAPPA